jgi:hypothetical protein
MSRIEELPAEERAVLQLALRQDRPFRDLAGLLDIDEAEMRRRAHAALEALGPEEAGRGLDAGRRAQIGDWLLGQQTEGDRADTERFLAGSATGRAWARVVADQLRGLGAQRLPEVPPAERADGARADGAGADGDGAAAPSPAEVAAASAPAAPTPAEPALPAAPVGAAMTPPGASAAAEAAAAAPEPADPGRLAAPRSSRLGGALLLGGLALVAVAVILFFVLRGGGSDSGSDAATPAASTTATQPQAQIEAQANLVPPSNRKSLKALGVVLVQRAQGQDQIVAAVQGLPKPKKGGYGIWLYSGPGKAQWLGFFASQDQQGRLLARGQLKASIADYREILVTREAKGNPARPGPIFLRGPVQLANSNGSG